MTMDFKLGPENMKRSSDNICHDIRVKIGGL